MGVYDHDPTAATGTLGKPANPDWHPMTFDSEASFRLYFCLPGRAYKLFRSGMPTTLPCRVYADEVRLGCTCVDNDAIRELYWWSNASPRWIRWVVRMWDAWKRKGIR